MTSSPVEPADAVARATLAVPAVSELHGGGFGQVATYLPGRRVVGVRLTPDVAEIHVTVTVGSDVHTVADHIRAAVRPLVGTPVDVFIEDVAAVTGPVAVEDPTTPR